MAYPGGKDTPGVWQRIVNQIPPHDVWISAFAGDCAVTRHIRPAAASVLIDLDHTALNRWHGRQRVNTRLLHADAVTWLRFAFFLQGATPNSASSAADADLCDGRPPRNLATAAAVAESSGGVLRRRSWRPGADAFFRGLVPETAWVARSSDGGSGDAGSCDGSRNGPRVFVYADPPYVHSTRGKDRIYQHEMTDEQHAEFLRIAKCLPCDVLIHGYPSSLYSEALQRWRTFTFKAMTRGGLRTEQVWCNYAEPTELHDYSQVGANKRQRERIRRRCRNWSAALARAGSHERGAILQALTRTAASAGSSGAVLGGW